RGEQCILVYWLQRVGEPAVDERADGAAIPPARRGDEGRVAAPTPIDRQAVQQQGAEAASLPVIGDHRGHLRDLWAYLVIPRDTQDLLVRGAFGGGGRDEGHAVVAVSARQGGCQLLGKLAQQVREPQKDRLGRQAEMEHQQPLHVLVVDRPQRDHTAVAQRAGASTVCGWLNRPRQGWWKRTRCWQLNYVVERRA